VAHLVLVAPTSPVVAPVAASASGAPVVLPTMPKPCTAQQAAAGDVATCLLGGPGGTPTARGFGEPPFPWVTAGAPLPWVDLTLGSSGHVVVALQRAIDAAGVDLVVDGSFGAKTVTAVKDYQQRVGLPATGVADGATAARLGISNSEPGPFPPTGFRWNGWGYNGSPALEAWDARIAANRTAIGGLAAGRLRVHPEVLVLFEGFLREVVDGGYPIRDLGGYVFRCTSNTRKDCNSLTPSSLSNHAFGLAIDVNTAANPELTYRAPAGGTACSVPQTTDIPQWVLDAALRWGLYWGGYGWDGGCRTPTEQKSSVLRDPMHFEFRGDVAQARAIAATRTFRSTATRVCAQVAGDDGVIRPACSETRLPVGGWRLPVDVGAPKGAAAALVNIALTEGATAGFVTAESCGPVASPVRAWANGTFPAAGTVSNLSVVPLDPDGRFCLFASKPVQTIVDVQGFFVGGGVAGAAGFVPIAQRRIVDTRESGRRAPGESPFALPALADVPAGATGILVNTAIAEASGPGFATLDRCARLSSSYPTWANVNYVPGTTVANLAVVPQPPAGGTAALPTEAAGAPSSGCVWPMAATHVVVDAQGAFVPGAGLGLRLVGPRRLVDTRECATHGGASRCGERVGAGQLVEVRGAGGSAALVNISLTDSSGDLFVVADRCDVLATNRPLRANGNTSRGRTVSNLAVVPVAEDGSFCVYASGPVHVIVDIQGVFDAAGPLRFVAQDPVRRHDTRSM